LIASIELEATDIDPKQLAALPQMRVVEPTLISEKRIMEFPKQSLTGDGLRCDCKLDRPWATRCQSEVAKTDLPATLTQTLGGNGALRTAEFGVNDYRLPGLTAEMILGSDWIDRQAAEIARHRVNSRSRRSSASYPKR